MPSPEVTALAALSTVAEERGLRILVVGALARQLVFDEPYRGQAYRATRDIDAGVEVADWNAYHELVAALVSQAGFERHGEHRLRHLGGVEVDLIPFGGVTDGAGNLVWQPSGRIMSLAGFSAADSHSRLMDFGSIRVRVVSLPGLVALKLFAYSDRYQRVTKDLQDLLFILMGATDELQDRVYAELEAELVNLDYEQLGPFLVGRDMAAMLPAHERDALLGILTTRLLTPPDYRALALADGFGDVERRIAWFQALHQGLGAKR